MNETQKRVAVIGAGIAGLSAAEELARAGFAPVVFDKGRGPGGRTSMRRAPPFEFDHGAQYFTARDEGFVERVRHWQSEGVVAPWTGRIVALASGRVSELREPTLRWVGVPAMNALATRLARELDVRCNTQVSSASFEGGAWRLRNAAGELLGHFELLVATLPLPQAAALFRGQSELAQRAAQVEASPCWAVLVGLHERLAVEFDGAFCHDSGLSWIARNNSKPGRAAGESWVLHATPEWTRAHLELPREQVAARLIDEFARASGVELQPLAHSDAHRWRYALPAPLEPSGPSSVASPAPLAWLDDARALAFAGDGCVGGRVEGAFLSGQAAARALVARG